MCVCVAVSPTSQLCTEGSQTHTAPAARPYSTQRPPHSATPLTGRLFMAQSPQTSLSPLESGSSARVRAPLMSHSLSVGRGMSATGHVGGQRARPQLSPPGSIATGQAPAAPITPTTALIAALPFLPPALFRRFTAPCPPRPRGTCAVPEEEAGRKRKGGG